MPVSGFFFWSGRPPPATWWLTGATSPATVRTMVRARAGTELRRRSRSGWTEILRAEACRTALIRKYDRHAQQRDPHDRVAGGPRGDSFPGGRVRRLYGR